MKDNMKKQNKSPLIHISQILSTKVWFQFCTVASHLIALTGLICIRIWSLFPTGGLKFLISESLVLTGGAKIDLFSP